MAATCLLCPPPPSPYHSEKTEFWEGLGCLVGNLQILWAIIGDLNEITHAKEKFGGRSVWRNKMNLRNFLQKSGGIDIGFCGSGFTWSNKQEGMTLIKECLDRVIGSK